MARRLRPHVLEDLGLRSALAALTTDLFAHSPTHVRRGVVPGLPTLDDAVELVIFRVAQEALTNVARHAAARDRRTDPRDTRTRRRPYRRRDRRSAASANGSDGTGLEGMRERAALVGGSLEVARRDGGGTVVTLVVPAAAS